MPKLGSRKVYNVNGTKRYISNYVGGHANNNTVRNLTNIDNPKDVVTVKVVGRPKNKIATHYTDTDWQGKPYKWDIAAGQASRTKPIQYKMLNTKTNSWEPVSFKKTKQRINIGEKQKFDGR